MKQALLVFIGGGFGSVARYLLGKWLNNIENLMPYGTLVANVLGSLLIGFILGYLAKTSSVSQTLSLLLVAGFCGGFTTFAAFTYENYLFIKSGDYFNFLTYAIGSLVLGVLSVFVGIYFSKLI